MTTEEKQILRDLTPESPAYDLIAYIQDIVLEQNHPLSQEEKEGKHHHHLNHHASSSNLMQPPTSLECNSHLLQTNSHLPFLHITHHHRRLFCPHSTACPPSPQQPLQNPVTPRSWSSAAAILTWRSNQCPRPVLFLAGRCARHYRFLPPRRQRSGEG